MELRWIERTEEQYPGAGFGFTQKVLQYRVMQTVVEKDRGCMLWSDWQDVPAVTEQEGEHLKRDDIAEIDLWNMDSTDEIKKKMIDFGFIDAATEQEGE